MNYLFHVIPVLKSFLMTRTLIGVNKISRVIVARTDSFTIRQRYLENAVSSISYLHVMQVVFVRCWRLGRRRLNDPVLFINVS